MAGIDTYTNKNVERHWKPETAAIPRGTAATGTGNGGEAKRHLRND